MATHLGPSNPSTALPAAKVDRQTTTPFLLKLFYRTGTFHRLDEFHPQSTTNANAAPLPAHLQIYTWQTCTLRELTHLLTSALPALLPSPAIGTRVAFRLVYPDTRPAANGSGPGAARYVSKELGSVVVGEGSREGLNGSGAQNGNDAAQITANLTGEAEKTLQDARFVIGDYVSCAIFPPLANGAVAPVPGPPGGTGPPMRGGYMPRGGAGYRENGAYGDGGFRVRGGGRGGYGDFGRGPPGPGLPSGEWRRGERIPDGPGLGGGYGRGRGRGRGW